jgi:hypothetical protein
LGNARRNEAKDKKDGAQYENFRSEPWQNNTTSVGPLFENFSQTGRQCYSRMVVSYGYLEHKVTPADRTNCGKPSRRMVFIIFRLYREMKAAYISENERDNPKPLLARGNVQAAAKFEQDIVLRQRPTRFSSDE